MILINIIILFLSILGAFFFAGTETGFVSWNPVKVSFGAKNGSLSAKLGLKLMRTKTQVLSAVLIGNNICVVGASLSFLFLYSKLDTFLPIDLSRIPSPESWFLSPVMVVLGEILPKTLFRIYSYKLTIKAMPLLFVVYLVTWPVTALVDFLSSFFKKRADNDENYIANVRKELVLVASEGAKQGVLFDNANNVVDNVLKVHGKSVADIMIPIEMFPVSKIVNLSCKINDITWNGSDTVIVVNDKTEPIGQVSVLDAIDSAVDARVEEVLTPFRVIEASSELLKFLTEFDSKYTGFTAVEDSDGSVIGLIDDMALCGVIFGN